MKVEITHDILAKKIYDRIGAEDKMRLKIIEFIGDRYLYFQEAGILLNSKDLNYIDPYLDKVSITLEQSDFIFKSQEEAKKRDRRRRISILAVISVLTLISLLSIIQWQEAVKANEAAARANERATAIRGTAVGIMLEETKNDIYHLNHDNAWVNIQVAGDLGLDGALTEKAIKQLLEIAFFKNEVGDLEQARKIALFADSLLAFPNTYRLKDPELSNRKDFRGELGNLGKRWKQWMDTLYQRTFPTMVYLDGKPITGVDSLQNVAPFEISSTEVTVWQYAIFCGATNPEGLEKAKPGWGFDQDNPIVNVSWFDAARFANWMTQRVAEERGREAVKVSYILDPKKAVVININDKVKGAFRLPRSREWAYAAHTEDIELIESQGWYDHNSDGRTKPVGKPVNPSSLMSIYDLGGNAWEWCEDDETKMEINSSYKQRPNEIEELYKGPTKVVRGGSWSYMDRITRTGNWQALAPQFTVDVVGFRLVRNPD